MKLSYKGIEGISTFSDQMKNKTQIKACVKLHLLTSQIEIQKNGAP